MWKRIKDNFEEGTAKIKRISSFIAERVKIEFSIFRLLNDREKKEKTKADKAKIIGERVLELKNSGEKNIFKDKIVIDTIAEIEKLDLEIEDLKQKTAEISKIEE
ncbi:MAG: hypothetical protein LLF28_02130 [Nitrospiraceae bacterium]|nr:hypothetical protein [Nitrospiraceae bacterium]